MPEGIEYDTRNGRILAGSFSQGTIFQIHADGRVTPAVTDPDLRNSVGIRVDAPRNRLLVVNSDGSVFQSTGPGLAKLGVYNLTTGQRIAMVDLATAITESPETAVYFANDVAVGDDGTAYVTDTTMSLVYRVSPDYKASVLHRFAAPARRVPPGTGVRPNGIVYHPSGYLLVGTGATLYKVPLANPAQATQVKLREAVPGQDGMVWTADGRLVIVSNAVNRTFVLRSIDDWASAELAGVATYSAAATSAVTIGDAVYVIHPHMTDAEPPSIERLVFQ